MTIYDWQGYGPRFDTAGKKLKQHSPEWFAARVGKVTASRMVDVMATIIKGEAATRRNYRRELALERFSGLRKERNYSSGAMQYGLQEEGAARTTGKIVSGQRREGVAAMQIAGRGGGEAGGEHSTLLTRAAGEVARCGYAS